ncbi:MAG: cysteine synthase A [Hyphomicrobiales bacterium]|nr:cysteine synthase A [Hyphomicrobiales bacterium]
MTIDPSVLAAIGNTPLIELRGPSRATGRRILGKAEFMNPGGSVKDRAALAIVRDGEARGLLKPGGVIVEGTAGNTGIGLTLVGAALGYKTVIVIPQTQSAEKKDMLRMQGAELVEVPAAPYANPNNYVKLSGRLAQETPGGFWANQFDNVANREGHRTTTGPEIYAQTGGQVDGFICAVGSGGTLGGVSLALKAHNPAIQIGIADPMGSALYEYYAHGALKASGGSITEGIGQGRITQNLEGVVVDRAYQISDDEALRVVFDLAEHEGLLLGGSSGVNVAGAMRMARDLPAGSTVVTVLCDGGARYAAKMFNPAFLREKGLPVPPWMERKSATAAPFV